MQKHLLGAVNAPYGRRLYVTPSAHDSLREAIASAAWLAKSPNIKAAAASYAQAATRAYHRLLAAGFSARRENQVLDVVTGDLVDERYGSGPLTFHLTIRNRLSAGAYAYDLLSVELDSRHAPPFDEDEIRADRDVLLDLLESGFAFTRADIVNDGHLTKARAYRLAERPLDPDAFLDSVIDVANAAIRTRQLIPTLYLNAPEHVSPASFYFELPFLGPDDRPTYGVIRLDWAEDGRPTACIPTLMSYRMKETSAAVCALVERSWKECRHD